MWMAECAGGVAWLVGVVKRETPGLGALQVDGSNSEVAAFD